jgi:Flp pilus assembly protein TadG
MRKSGQTLVEFAVIIPLLALALFAIIQYAIIFNAFMTLRHGAQVTSRSFALPTTGASNATDIACQSIQTTLDCARLTAVNVDSNKNVGGIKGVEVTLTYRLPLIISFVVPRSTNGVLTLTAVAVDRKY